MTGPGRRFDPTELSDDPAALSEADLVFLALPHGESAAVAAQLPDEVKVVDLGADFRLRDAEPWAKYYGRAHAEFFGAGHGVGVKRRHARRHYRRDWPRDRPRGGARVRASTASAGPDAHHR